MNRFVAVVAGLDTSGGAGLAADLRTASALRIPCAAVLTAVAVQDAEGVHAVFPTPEGAFTAQLRAVPWKKTGACKLGMVYLPELLDLFLDALPDGIPLVVDPLLGATAGGSLAAPGLEEALAAGAFPRATLVTLNRDEVRRFSGEDFTDLATARGLAPRLAERLGTSVLLKGGHLRGTPVDVLAVGGCLYEFSGRRAKVSPRGTGCTLSTAVAAYLAVGDELPAAVGLARELVNRAVAAAYPGPAGPVLAP
ncbi:MAG: hydroxymethylpyrimidine/phosphomethylpyrimidine kinase [bacterium]|nr:hydroxymethylpyrimidine/phosphomethylpyrimidine kinase [bacterium]